jgi:hypothetical protein
MASTVENRLVSVEITAEFTRATPTVGQVLISSIKGEVKKKHVSVGRSFSCFPAHVAERDLF